MAGAGEQPTTRAELLSVVQDLIFRTNQGNGKNNYIQTNDNLWKIFTYLIDFFDDEINTVITVTQFPDAKPTTGLDNGDLYVGEVETEVWDGSDWVVISASSIFNEGTSGNDFNIDDSTPGTYVFNIPTSSATKRGLLSTTDWSTFNSKESALTFNNGLTRTSNTVSIDYTRTGNVYTGNGLVSSPLFSFTGTPYSGGSSTTTKPYILVEPSGTTSNNWSTSGTMYGINAPSGFVGNILDYQINATRLFNLDYTGKASLLTSLTTPKVIGGTGTTSTLTYQTTSGVGATGADHIFLVGNNGGTEAMRILNNGTIKVGGSQLTQNYTTSNNWGTYLINTSSAGTSYGLRVDAGSNSSDLTAYFTNSSASSAYFSIRGDGNVGIGTINPVSRLAIPISPSSSAQYGLASFGDGGFSGSANHFSGSANGTLIAGNITGSADLINLQGSGTQLFKVMNTGNTQIGAIPTALKNLATPLIVHTGTDGNIIFTQNSVATILALDDANTVVKPLQFRASTYIFADIDADKGVFIGNNGYGYAAAARLDVLGNTNTGSQAYGILNLAQTWNTTGTPTAIKLNVTNTTSNAASLLMDLQVDGSSKFSVSKAGLGYFVSSVYAGFDAGFHLDGGVGTVGVRGSGINGQGMQIKPFIGASYYSGLQILSLGNPFENTSGVSRMLSVSNPTFSITSGNGEFQPFAVTYTINNTGTTSGSVVNGIYLNATETSLTGTTHNLMDLQVSGSTKFKVGTTYTQSGNHFEPSAGNTYDLGYNYTWRNYRGSGWVEVGSAAYIGFQSRSLIQSSADGKLTLLNNNFNDFNLLQFGGTSSSFPALKRSSATLQVRLADDSAYTNLAVVSETYGAGWSGSQNVPTKGDLYTKIESLGVYTASNGVTLVGSDFRIDYTRGANVYTANGAVSASLFKYNGTWYSGGSSITTKPFILLEPSGATSSAWSTSGTALGINSASGFVGRFFDLQVNGSSKAWLAYTGQLDILSVTIQGSGAIELSGSDLSLASGFSKTTLIQAAVVGKPVLTLTGAWYTGGGATSTKPMYLIEPSGTTSTGWDNFGTGLGVNATNGFLGTLASFQVAGVRKVDILYTGIVRSVAYEASAIGSTFGVTYGSSGYTNYSINIKGNNAIIAKDGSNQQLLLISNAGISIGNASGQHDYAATKHNFSAAFTGSVTDFDYCAKLTGSVSLGATTSRTLNGLYLNNTLSSGANSQTLIALNIRASFSDSYSATKYLIRASASDVDQFTLNSVGNGVFTGSLDAASYKVGGVAGVSGTITAASTVTVVNGIITAIVG